MCRNMLTKHRVVIYYAFCLDVAQSHIQMGQLMRLELTCEGLLVKLANHCTTSGAQPNPEYEGVGLNNIWNINDPSQKYTQYFND